MTSPFWLPIWLLALSSAWQGVVPTHCPTGWVAYSNHCYGLFYEKLTWQEAEEECQGYGINGHLASVLSWVANELISSHISTQHKNVKYVWIGLHNTYRMKMYKWVDGSPLDYTAWADFEPDYSLLKKQCVHLVDLKRHREWASVDCEEKASYLCSFTSA